MGYPELLDSVLQIALKLKDEQNCVNYDDLYAALNDRGKILEYLDSADKFHNVLRTDEFSPYLTLESSTGGDDEHTLYRILLTEEGVQRATQLNAARFENPQSLFNWGFMGRYSEKIDQLAEMALPENWNDPGEPNGVLKSYIAVTFQRLLQERKEGNEFAIVETEKWATFNTGLVDKLYEPIYALFSINKRPDMQKWVFQAWCTPGNRRAGQVLSRFFDRLPRKASYFSRPSEFLYDPAGGVPTLPFEHILERLDRLPLDFLRNFKPEGFDWPEDNIEADEDFYPSFRKALEEDDYLLLQFRDALDLSLRRAIRRVSFNYRLALPIYDAKRRKMMLLIPMSLNFRNIEHVDIALVAERAKISQRYVGHTIYTLPMAYRKARMVMRLESDWLTPSISNSSDLHKVRSDEDNKLLALEISESDTNAVEADIEAQRQKEKEEEATVDASNPSTQFLTQHDNNDIFRPEVELNQVKVLDHIPLDVLEERSARYGKRKTLSHGYDDYETPAERDEKASYTKPLHSAPDPYDFELPKDKDYDIRGLFREGMGCPYILVGGFRYAARQLTDSGLIDDDEVLFDLKSEPNLKGYGTYYYAVNVRLADD